MKKSTTLKRDYNMKLKNGKTWCLSQLEDYTSEFKDEIIIELFEMANDCTVDRLDGLTMCKSCFSMTKTIDGKCGKCREVKE